MRTVEEYLAKAEEFDAMASRADAPMPLRLRYADMAECYRLLAKERERLIAQGALEGTEPGA
jgi:hypothetical protein